MPCPCPCPYLTLCLCQPMPASPPAHAKNVYGVELHAVFPLHAQAPSHSMSACPIRHPVQQQIPAGRALGASSELEPCHFPRLSSLSGKPPFDPSSVIEAWIFFSLSPVLLCLCRAASINHASNSHHRTVRSRSNLLQCAFRCPRSAFLSPPYPTRGKPNNMPSHLHPCCI